MSNRIDFTDLAREFVAMFGLDPDAEREGTGKLQWRLERELYNAHVAGQEQNEYELDAELKQLRAMRDALVTWRADVEAATLDHGWQIVDRIDKVLAAAPPAAAIAQDPRIHPSVSGDCERSPLTANDLRQLARDLTEALSRIEKIPEVGLALKDLRYVRDVLAASPAGDHTWVGFDRVRDLASHQWVIADVERTGASFRETEFCARCPAVRAVAGGRPAWLSALQVAVAYYGPSRTDLGKRAAGSSDSAPASAQAEAPGLRSQWLPDGVLSARMLDEMSATEVWSTGGERMGIRDGQAEVVV